MHFSLVLVTIGKTYQASKTAFNHISKPHGVMKMLCDVVLNSSQRLEIGQTLSFVFDINYHIL